ncbi:hypothetical protein VNO77_20979 [Canavalia gladiata]|uniref:Secreted protein n=1 Tax=Canavalia gladiata TaxID=3824 RepID=A0AAN9QLW1_CANGL
MSITKGICQIVAVLLLLGSLNVYSLECEDDRCKTELCSSTDACFCKLPDPFTILDGDRFFLGQKKHIKYQNSSSNTLSSKHSYMHSPLYNVALIIFLNENMRLEAIGERITSTNIPLNLLENIVSILEHPVVRFSVSIMLNGKAVLIAPFQPHQQDTCCLGTFFCGCWCHLWQETTQQKKRDAVKFQQLSEMQTLGTLDDDEDEDENHSMVPERVHDDFTHI